ncbi:MAG: hypothetical protein GX558_05385, partial [Clostridiales bacterium]|nr:hypothetical protein [Clostridiales bacterium]
MENARLNLNRVTDIIAELEERLTPLREQSRAAREYIQLREELKGLELNAFLQRSDRYAARVAELTAQMASLAESADAASERRAALAAARDVASEALEALERESAAGRERVQALIGAVEAREGAVAVGRERAQSLARELERLGGERQLSERGGEELAARLDELATRIAAERQAWEAEGEALSTDERDLAQRSIALAEREERAEALKAGIIDAMNRLSDVRSEQSRLTAMRDALETRLSALDGDGRAERDALAERQARLAGAQTALSRERAEHASLSAMLSRLATDLAADAQLCDALGEKIRALTASRGDASSRLRVLREMQRDYEGYQHSVKQVLLQARRTADSGVHGVVASLIQAPRELELALDMALGAALQNVVVEREEDAKRLIEYLRANRLGRATFLPLNSIAGRSLSAAERQALTLPGCLGVASELIAFDARYRGVVENLLGRTVVARDLAAGIAIQRAGRHQFRLVTLDGDVMNPGGSMTGGSVQSRVTSLLSREREIAEHEALVKRVEGELAAAQRELAQREAHRGELKLQRGELYERIKQQEILCARAEAHVKAASDGLKESGDRLARLTGEAERLAEQLAGVVKSLDALSNRQGDAEQASGDRQAEVARLTGRIAAERDALAADRRAVNERQVRQAARERGIQALEADRRRLIAERERMAGLLADGRASLETCEQRLAEARQALADGESSLRAEKVELQQARAAFGDADGRRVAAQREIQALGGQLDQLSAEVEELADRQRRGEVQLARVEGEFKQLTDRIWEDYELTYAGAEVFRLPDFKLGEADRRIAELRQKIRALGAVNVGAVDEYRAISDRHEQLCAQRDDLTKAQIDLMGIIEELVRKMEVRFREQFTALNENFGRTFNRLFGGGRAELQLTDPKDVLNCGIEVIAQPPG